MKQINTEINDFKELLDNDCYYVDKTMLIEDVLSDKVMWYTRPRCFDKNTQYEYVLLFFFLQRKH